jgi:hypothetical protein
MTRNDITGDRIAHEPVLIQINKKEDEDQQWI